MALFERSDDAQRLQLFGNIAEAMQGVSDDVIRHPPEHFRRMRAEYAEGVATALGITAA